METDLVNRLKAAVPYLGKSEMAFLCHDAAAEIEQLRVRVAQLEQHLSEAMRIADQALSVELPTV